MGGKQLGFSDYELTTAKKQTKREKFLAEMEAVVPWQALIDLIEPHYHKASKKGGRPPNPLATMLRIHLLQQWYSLSDSAIEEALIEVPTMRRYAGIELISDRIPDETTILTFRHLLEKHKLGEQIIETVKALLTAPAWWASFPKTPRLSDWSVQSCQCRTSTESWRRSHVVCREHG